MGVGGGAGVFESAGEETGVAETSVGGGDGEDGDVAVPGETVGVVRGEVRDGVVERGGFEFSHY